MQSSLPRIIFSVGLVVVLLLAAGAGLLVFQPVVVPVTVVADDLDQAPPDAVLYADEVAVPLDANGQARIEVTRWRAFPTLRAEAPGYYPVVRQSSGVAGVRLPASLTFKFEPRVLVGTVYAADTDEPLAGAVVQVGELQTTTDALGQFRLSHAPTQAGPLRAAAEGYALAFLPPETWPDDGQLTIELNHPVLRGQLTRSDNAGPVPTARVVVGGHAVQFDATGHFEAPAPVLPVAVEVTAPGFAPFQVTLDDADQIAQNIIVLELDPIPLHGRVVDALTAEPLAGARVQADGQEEITDASGAVTLWGLAEGAELTVQAAGYRAADPVVGTEAEVELGLWPEGTLVQVVDAATGGPVPGATVEAGGHNAITSEAGYAHLPTVEPGTAVEVSVAGYHAQEVAVENPDDVRVELSALALEGVVRAAASGEPIPFALVYARAGDEQLHTQADAEGRYVLEGLPAPAEALLVKVPGYGRATWPDPSYFWDGLAPADVKGEIRFEDCDGTPCANAYLEPFNAYGIYVPVHMLGSRERMIAYLDFAARAPALNALVVDVKGDRGEIMWPSQAPEAQQTGAIRADGNWMDLRELIEESRARDIYLIGRFVVFKDDPLARAFPEWAVRAVDKPDEIWVDGEKLAWVDPFREEVQSYMIALAQELAELGVDEIQFDYHRFSGHRDHSQYIYSKPSTPENRAAAITGFTQALQQGLRPYPVFTSVDVLGWIVWTSPGNENNTGQVVEDIAAAIDYLSPMNYPHTFGPGTLGYQQSDRFPYEVIQRSQIRAQERVQPPTKIRPWLQGYWYTSEAMQLQRLAAEDAGADGWMFWNAGGQYQEALFVEPLPREALMRVAAQMAGQGAPPPPPPPPQPDPGEDPPPAGEGEEDAPPEDEGEPPAEGEGG